MERKEFGQLVAALRQDMGWTQAQLSEFAKIDEAVLSQIERGVKKYFEPDLLFHLMNALQLTTLERKEFILESSGLSESHVVRQPSASVKTDAFDASKALNQMLHLIDEIRLPAYLCDDYGDVLAANHMILDFYKVPASMLESSSKVPGGFNTTRLNFSKDLVGRNHIVDNWDAYAIKVMRGFRDNTFPCRTKPYFRYLMKAFHNPTEYPLFDRYWKLVSSTENDKELNMDYFSYQHTEYGELKYISSETISITSFGRLHLVKNIPLNENTHQLFDGLLKNVGIGAVRLAPWPEKIFI